MEEERTFSRFLELLDEFLAVLDQRLPDYIPESRKEIIGPLQEYIKAGRARHIGMIQRAFKTFADEPESARLDIETKEMIPILDIWIWQLREGTLTRGEL